MLTKTLISTSAAVALIGSIIVGYIYLDDTYARNSRVDVVEQRLEVKITVDLRNELRQRLWQMEGYYGPQLQRADEPTKREYRRIEVEKKELDAILRQMRINMRRYK